jgi:outer membrane protein TolC
MQKTITLLLVALCVGTVSLKAQSQEVVAQGATLSITLDKALEIALSENPTIKIADKEIERTNYAKKEAIGNLIPSVSGSASYQRALKDSPMFFSGFMASMLGFKEGDGMRNPSLRNSYTAGVDVTVPLFSMGLYKNIQLANLNVEVALEASRESKVALKNEVEKAYYMALLAENSFEVIEASMKNAEENYRNIKLKYNEGVVAEFDMIRSEVQVSNIRPSYIQAKNNLLITDLQLKLLMGLPLDITLAIEGDLMEFKDEYKRDNNLYGYTLDKNTDLRKLTLQEGLLQKQLQLQKTQRMPTLGAAFSYNLITQNNNFKFGKYIWYDTPTIGLSLSVPIFNGFTLKNKEKQTKLAIDQLHLQKEYVTSGLNVQVSNALNTMSNAVEEIEANISSVNLAERACEISKTRYDSGLGTLVELNDAEVALTQAMLNYNSAIYSYLTAKSDYIKLLGNSF